MLWHHRHRTPTRHPLYGFGETQASAPTRRRRGPVENRPHRNAHKSPILRPSPPPHSQTHRQDSCRLHPCAVARWPTNVPHRNQASQAQAAAVRPSPPHHTKKRRLSSTCTSSSSNANNKTPLPLPNNHTSTSLLPLAAPNTPNPRPPLDSRTSPGCLPEESTP